MGSRATTNNLGKYLHPQREAAPGRKSGATRQDAPGMASTKRDARYAAAVSTPLADTYNAAGQKPEPWGRAARRTKSDAPPTAEERFYRSATPASVQGAR